jgi:hypothetical protein
MDPLMRCGNAAESATLLERDGTGGHASPRARAAQFSMPAMKQ